MSFQSYLIADFEINKKSGRVKNLTVFDGEKTYSFDFEEETLFERLEDINNLFKKHGGIVFVKPNWYKPFSKWYESFFDWSLPEFYKYADNILSPLDFEPQLTDTRFDIVEEFLKKAKLKDRIRIEGIKDFFLPEIKPNFIGIIRLIWEGEEIELPNVEELIEEDIWKLLKTKEREYKKVEPLIKGSRVELKENAKEKEKAVKLTIYWLFSQILYLPFEKFYWNLVNEFEEFYEKYRPSKLIVKNLSPKITAKELKEFEILEVLTVVIDEIYRKGKVEVEKCRFKQPLFKVLKLRLINDEKYGDVEVEDKKVKAIWEKFLSERINRNILVKELTKELINYLIEYTGKEVSIWKLWSKINREAVINLNGDVEFADRILKDIWDTTEVLLIELEPDFGKNFGTKFADYYPDKIHTKLIGKITNIEKLRCKALEIEELRGENAVFEVLIKLSKKVDSETAEILKKVAEIILPLTPKRFDVIKVLQTIFD